MEKYGLNNSTKGAHNNLKHSGNQTRQNKSRLLGFTLCGGGSHPNSRAYPNYFVFIILPFAPIIILGVHLASLDHRISLYHEIFWKLNFRDHVDHPFSDSEAHLVRVEQIITLHCPLFKRRMVGLLSLFLFFSPLTPTTHHYVKFFSYSDFSLLNTLN